MSFQQFGDAKYVFAFAAESGGDTSAAADAIEAALGVAPQELQISGEPEFTAEAEGADGTIEGYVVAQDKHTWTLTGFLTDKTQFEEEGLTFTHDGKFFIVTGRQITKAGKMFQKAQLTGVCFKGITGPAA